MGLTLITHPVGAAAQKIFAGFKPVEFIFKREDLEITDIVSGTGGIKLNVTTDLTSYLTKGDAIYVYSEGTNYIYDAIGIILTITASEITLDIQYVESATGGYINYLKNYYIELQCIDKSFTAVNLLPFSLQSDGDAAGNISIDVSVLNDKNRQRGAITQGGILESRQEFNVRYKPVYVGSTETFTNITDKLLILVYATVEPEVGIILNNFTVPKLFLGYEGAIVQAIKDRVEGETIMLNYKELDINQLPIASGNLGSLNATLNGFLLWKWLKNATVNNKTKYIEFETAIAGISDFANPDFASPDFLTT